LGKKNKKAKIKIKKIKKHVGKAKAKFSASSILKKINLTKRILKNKYVEKYCSKTKTMSGKYCSNLQCFFIKKLQN